MNIIWKCINPYVDGINSLFALYVLLEHEAETQQIAEY